MLSELPEGFTQEIVARANQPADQPYTFEVNYHGSRMRSSYAGHGQLDAGFVETNFYDSSYKTASGLVLYFSPSDGGSTAAPPHTGRPSGNSFLLISSLPREQVQNCGNAIPSSKPPTKQFYSAAETSFRPPFPPQCGVLPNWVAPEGCSCVRPERRTILRLPKFHLDNIEHMFYYRLIASN